jgi:hypothetical protein
MPRPTITADGAWYVNFRADHALQSLTATKNRFPDAEVKVFACAPDYSK